MSVSHVAVVGTGRSGTHAAQAVRRLRPTARLTLVDRDVERARRAGQLAGGSVLAAAALSRRDPPDVVLLCVSAGDHAPLARQALRMGAHVVSSCDSIVDTEALLGLGDRAQRASRALVVGAGFSPGLSCLLVAHAAHLFDEVREVSVFKSGTGGPDCARQHHRALRLTSVEWRDGGWARRRGSTGRRLAWFPDPVGALDCYRAGLPEPLLAARAFPDPFRLSARMAATRRDRLTGWLPMLRRPHADGGPGGLRVEVRGRRGNVEDIVVYGAVDHPARVSGVLGAVVADRLLAGRLPAVGVYGLAELLDPIPVLVALAQLGVGLEAFDGAD